MIKFFFYGFFVERLVFRIVGCFWVGVAFGLGVFERVEGVLEEYRVKRICFG